MSFIEKILELLDNERLFNTIFDCVKLVLATCAVQALGLYLMAYVNPDNLMRKAIFFSGQIVVAFSFLLVIVGTRQYLKRHLEGKGFFVSLIVSLFVLWFAILLPFASMHKFVKDYLVSKKIGHSESVKHSGEN